MDSASPLDVMAPFVAGALDGLAGADVEAHRRAEAELAALFAGAPLGLAVFDRALRYQRVNEVMASFKGVPPEAHLGRTLAEMLPERAAVLEPIHRRVLETGEPLLDQEIELRGRDYLASYFPVRIAGEIVGVASLVQDHTERRRVERGLALLARAGEALMGELDTGARLGRLAHLLVPDLADVASVFLTDDRGEIELVETWALDPAQRAFTVARARRHHPGKDLPQGVAQVIRRGQSELIAEISDAHLVAAAHDAEDLAALRRFGPCAWMGVPIRARGRTLGALSLSRGSSGAGARGYDASHLALAEELARRAAVALENAQLFELAERERRRAEEAGRLKDEFLANLSHELRTPLTAILGWSRVLRTRALPDDKRARALESIERNALAQARLVEDLLDISRILGGQLTLERGSVELGRVIETALAAARPAAVAKGLRVVSVIDPRGATLCGDAERLRQVVANLLSNAVKFTPAGGSIEVHLERDGTSARLVVSDTGQGIRRDFLPHAFDRFRQADGGLTRAHGGLGVGLSIARSLIELHGGTLDAHSAGEGHGATFTVRVPLAPG